MLGADSPESACSVLVCICMMDKGWAWVQVGFESLQWEFPIDKKD